MGFLFGSLIVWTNKSDGQLVIKIIIVSAAISVLSTLCSFAFKYGDKYNAARRSKTLRATIDIKKKLCKRCHKPIGDRLIGHKCPSLVEYCYECYKEKRKEYVRKSYHKNKRKYKKTSIPIEKQIIKCRIFLTKLVIRSLREYIYDTRTCIRCGGSLRSTKLASKSPNAIKQGQGI